MGTFMVNHEASRDCPCGCEGRVIISIGCGCAEREPTCDHETERYEFTRDEWDNGGEWFIIQLLESHRRAAELRDLNSWTTRNWQAEVAEIEKISYLVLRERKSAASDHRLRPALVELLRQLLCLIGSPARLNEDGDVEVEVD
jgi:hypothetical protein